MPVLRLLLSVSAQAKSHKARGVPGIAHNETNDLALKILLCRGETQVTERGDIHLSDATVYFRMAKSRSQTLNAQSGIRKGKTTSWTELVAV
ncbi:DUF2541 family protein [Cronobacter turicensis]